MSDGAKAGDRLRLHYVGHLEDDSVFDSSEGRDPLDFTLGSGEIIPGLDAGLQGMTVGESRSVTVAPQDGYGDRDPGRIQSIPREIIPEHIPTESGTMLQMQSPEGETIPVTVLGTSDTHVEMDANHPLAGKTLRFEVTLVEIV